MLNRVAAMLALVVLPYASDSVAHHSFAAEFDYESIGTVEGEVIEVLYVNPHARYFLEVIDADGNTVLWDAQSRSPSALQRVGWTRDTLKLGERVVIEGNLGHGNARKIWIRKVTRTSGEVVQPYGGASDEDDDDAENR